MNAPPSFLTDRDSGPSAPAPRLLSRRTRPRLGFTGRETSPLTGLVYLRNRWYSPTLGRFLSQDPIGLAGGLNLHSYAGNSPIGQSDPTGEVVLSAVAFLLLAGGAGAGIFGGVAAARGGDARQIALSATAGLGIGACLGLAVPAAGTAGTSAGRTIGAFLETRFPRISGLIFGTELASSPQSPPPATNPSTGCPLARLSSFRREFLGLKILGERGLARNIFQVESRSLEFQGRSLLQVRQLARVLEQEARAAGATQLRIIGTGILDPPAPFADPRFLSIARRLGFSVRQIPGGVLELIKPIQ